MIYPADILQPIKTFLEEKKLELVTRRDRLVKEDPFTDVERLNNNAAVDADAAEQFGHETATAMRQEIERKLIEVESAMERIEAGSYGNCVGCGAMIDTDRLKVDPTVGYCVDCQRKKIVVE